MRPGKSRVRWGIWLVAAVGFVLVALAATAQQTTALSGTVTDASGAVIPGAQVSAALAGDGLRAKAVADGEGIFRFPGLAPGEYAVTASAPGFAAAQHMVTVGTTAVSITLALSVGQTSQTVAVSASAAMIDTTSTATGGLLDAKQMQAVPLNGRSFTDALAVEPGVAPASSAQPNAIVMSGVASTPPSGELDSGTLSIGGQRETANSFRVNGADAQEDVNMGVAIVPVLDSIAELNVVTGNDAPEYGTASGGQIAVVTKSGTNEWHGSAFRVFAKHESGCAELFFAGAGGVSSEPVWGDGGRAGKEGQAVCVWGLSGNAGGGGNRYGADFGADRGGAGGGFFGNVERADGESGWAVFCQPACAEAGL